MPIQKLIKRLLILRYKYISQKNFIFLLAILIGLLAGLVSVLIKNITFGIEWILDHLAIVSRNSIYFILPVIGLWLVYLFVKYVSKKPIEHAIPSILFALSKKDGLLARSRIYLPLITAPLTAGFGGSVGLLGPAIASASGVSSNIGQLFHVDRKTRTLLIGCAAAGAIASIFQSPIAAIIFAIEVFSLDLTFASLLPLLIASVSSVLTSYFFVGNGVLFNFNVNTPFELRDTIFFIILGIGTGIASIYFSKIYFAVYKFFDRFKTNGQKLIVGGLAIGVMLYLIPPLYGEGFGFINDLLEGNHLHALGQTPFDDHLDKIWVVIALLIGITIFKAVAMTTTFAAGGAGGIIIPTMVMGSALGNVVAKIINNIGLGYQVSESNFTLIGMAGLIAGVLHAPLTAIFLIAEITGGYQLFVPLMITVSMSFIITKNTIDHTIYTKELAEKGALLTHDKDQSILTLMKLDNVIEKDFTVVHPEMSLGQMLHEGVAKSSRNLFPVVDEQHYLVGIIFLDDIRTVMFDSSLHDTTSVETFMHNPAEHIHFEMDSVKDVMRKFQDTGAWNLPVIRNNKYYGIVSKSKLLTAYRRELINFTA
ncbi:chloride channel protein [Psychroserpens sp.]|uniref:chloride channel protein n=1 Tax=Psychroserpens sp. TaxID=2020870 RepID=UPI001B2A47B3|nr:chloride channel protein [Psychroserpens sp.]MBO6607768.1 chloride channel protein [Psychroserpens sp.]MBO6654759.1 chloride channel protein [Psychroserpens sp.]MBO6682817.1 chloride channel protein [Psychroserpens sp.]MBO6751126.1 chloride channel protein [Psychroserpens sp.]MBO6916305.1 chloride channel protein [Psychroserpens sp.]